MEASQSSFRLSERDASKIRLFCGIAELNGSALTITELLLLTDINVSESDLASALSDSGELSARYELKSGMIIEKGSKGSVEHEYDRRMRAERGFELARSFATACRSDATRLISVSGSTSYRSASKRDDVDLFCVTKTNELWPFITKSLLLARSFRQTRKGSPQLCLSYVIDEEYASRAFSEPKDALFARDALSAAVMHGSSFYADLLRKSAWMSRYFPRLYVLRASGRVDEEFHDEDGSHYSQAQKVLNAFLYLTVGSYIRVKSFLLNRRFAKAGQTGSLFRLKIGLDHCVFESQRYIQLRRMYSGFDSSPAKRASSSSHPRGIS